MAQASSGGESGLLVMLDLRVDKELQEQGLCREVTNRVQKLRKKAKLEPEDAIEVFCASSNEQLLNVLTKRAAEIGERLKVPPPLGEKPLFTQCSHFECLSPSCAQSRRLIAILIGPFALLFVRPFACIR